MSKTENQLRSPQDVVRDFFNVGHVKRVFRVGAEVFNAVHPFVEHPTAINGLKAAFNVGKIFVDDMEVWPDDFFDDSWESPFSHDFNSAILRSLHGFPYKVIKSSEATLVIHIVQLEDVRVGYVINTKNDNVDRLYVEASKMTRARELIKRELWKMLKHDNVVLRNRRRSSGHDNEFVSLEVDDAFCPLESKRATEYSSYLKKCIDADVSRSVMLYGPPGTGKSTMARTLVDKLGMRSFRIRVEDIGHIENSTLFEAITIFEPDAVILDDFDRASSQSSLLETLEYFQRHVKLVIATVNNRNSLDEAILRPGRFDELLHVKQMDDEVVRSLLGPENESSFETVKDWPIAFVQEFVKRRRFMTVAEAEESTKELASRVKRLTSYDDKDEEESLNLMLKKQKKQKISQGKPVTLEEALRYKSGRKGPKISPDEWKKLIED
jgi:ATPase family associated with various cellular activities (AAA)